MSDLTAVGLAVAAYTLVVLAVGAVAARGVGKSPDEYFMAGRTLGTMVLFMALFGTNCSPFVLVGIPGRAYLDGLGVFGLNAPLIALLVPLTFYAVGAPARRMAARLGALTPVELYARRLDSRAAGFVLFAVFTIYTVPYMVTGTQGIAVSLAQYTDGRVSERAVACFVMALALFYTTLGGMRATAWTNVVQGWFFLSFTLLALYFLLDSFGGPRAAMEALRDQRPDLLIVDRDHPRFRPGAWLSYGVVLALTVIAFPHMFARLMAARDDGALRGAFRLYPPALLLLWMAVVLIGVLGALVAPGLVEGNSDRIFSIVAAERLPAGFSALAVVAILAAVMSTLDAQLLTLGSMISRDVLPHIAGGTTGAAAVRAGRVFGVVVAIVVLVVREEIDSWSIVRVAKFAFSGYVTLVPTLYLGLVWRRFTAAGAIASIAAGNATLLACERIGALPLGVIPGFVGLLVALAVAWVVSLLTPPPPQDAVARAFGPPPDDRKLAHPG